MVEVHSPRTPPPLDPTPRPMSLCMDFDPKVMPILDTYSPFPTFGSRDPFGLDAYLLHPHDAVWEFRHDLSTEEHNDAPADGNKLGLKRATMSALRRSSPLASNPPLSAETRDETTEIATRSTTPPPRPPRRSSTNGLRTYIGRKSSAIPGSESPDSPMPSTPEDDDAPLSQRPTSMSSLLSSSGSSSDSCDGPRTPKESPTMVDVSAQLTAALQEDQRKRSSWRDWLGGRRTSFLGLRGGETGTTLLESPRASIIDLAPEVPADDDAPLDTDGARSAAQLRRLSLVKLGTLRMPSPHPLAPVLARQNLPNEVAFAIPSSKRVYPNSVNAAQNTELGPAQGGLRVALALRSVIVNLDNGERPSEPFRPHKPERPTTLYRARGVRDFVERRPFEERMVVYYPDDTLSQVTMARSGFAIYDVEYTDYIVALAAAEDAPPAWKAPKVRTSPRPPLRSATTAPIVTVTKATPSPVKEEKRVHARPTPAAFVTEPVKPQSSFRTARPRPSTWDDSSDEEEAPKTIEPVRPPNMRTRTAPIRRDSRPIDANAALDMITKARERRQEFSTGELERRAGAEARKSIVMDKSPEKRPVDKRSASKSSLASDRRVVVDDKRLSAAPPSQRPSKRVSTMALSTQAKEQDASHSGQRTPPKQRVASSLPGSPKMHAASIDSRRVVSHYEQPPLHQRASMMNLNMYAQPMMPVAPGLPHRNSMMFTPMLSPMHTGQVHPAHAHMAPMGMPPMAPMLPMQPMGYQFAQHAQYAPTAAPSYAGYVPQGRRRERPVA